MELQLHDGLEAWNWRKIRRAAMYTNPITAAAQVAYQNRRRLGKFAKQAATTYNPYYRAGKFGYQQGRRLWSKLLNEAQGTPTYTQFLNEENLSGNEPFELQAGRFGKWIKTKAVPGLTKLQTKLSPIIGLLPGGGAVNAAFDIIKRPDGSAAPTLEPVLQPTGPIMPTQLAPAPQFAPMPEPMPTAFPAFAPMPAPSGLPFGLDMKTLLLLGIGGIVAYKAFKK
jgi:hypothetical protein